MILSNQPPEHNAPPMIKSDPRRKTTLNKSIMTTIIGLQLSVFIILIILENISKNTGVPLFYWFYLFMSLLMLVLQIPSRKERRAWKHYEQRRQLAAQGNREQVTLAAVQPVPNASVGSLPITLRTKNRFSPTFNIFAILLVLVIPVLIFTLIPLLLNISIGHFSVTPLLLIAFIPLELLLSFCGINIILVSRHDSQQLQFTEAGILRQTRKKVTVIPWEEARLFAIVPLSPDLRKTNSPFTAYELSSANEVLRWSTSGHIALFIGQTRLTPREHRQQMQALLSVIATKTNLPLYDLR